MSKEIFINVTANETRVAFLESAMLQEFHIERTNNLNIVGNIYMGKIVRILPGMQAAFIDIGLSKAAFLHIDDVINTNSTSNDTKEDNTSQPCISEILVEGKNILVQVIKDVIGTKGARLTTKISLVGRYLVYMPSLDKIAISSKILIEEERERLYNILFKDVEKGYIIRTAAEDASEKEISKDIEYLSKLWDILNNKISSAKAGTVIHTELLLGLKCIRDHIGLDVDKISIDSKELYDESISFAQKLCPELIEKMHYYSANKNIFDLHGIEDELKKALNKDVTLKSGGYIVIEQTEALTSIDVNTGSFVGRNSLEETLYKTNLEAAQAIARQLRLRNLGGIIVVDFIDLENQKHWQHTLDTLEKELAKDTVKNKIHAVSPLGLVEITRKRTRESLEHILCEKCQVCDGSGYVKSIETICNDILRDLLRTARAYAGSSYMVLANTKVVDEMLEQHMQVVSEMEEMFNASIKFRVGLEYSQQQFDVVLV